MKRDFSGLRLGARPAADIGAGRFAWALAALLAGPGATPVHAHDLPQEWAGFVAQVSAERKGPVLAREWQRLNESANSLGLPLFSPADRAWLSAAQAGRWPEVADQLRKAGADLNLSARDPDTGASVLALAAAAGQAELLREMLKRGAHPDLRGADGQTALNAAVFAGRLSAVQALLKAGADPRLPGPTGQPALHTACLSGQTAVIQELLKSGADIAYENRRREPAFIVAARFGQIDAMQALAAAGWNVNTPDARGLNALHAAAVAYQAGAVAWLRDQGLQSPSPVTDVLIEQMAQPPRPPGQ